MVTADEVKAAVASLEPSHVEVTDISGGCGASFEVVLVSAKFDGVALLQRHRMVNTALADAGVGKELHAVTIKAMTPAQWAAKAAAAAAAAPAPPS